MSEEEVLNRKCLFNKARRIVVKVGSAVLTDVEGINEKVVESLAKELSYLHQQGKEVILVSSGAVAAGRRKLKDTTSAPLGIKEKQAFAAIGQSSLMERYDRAFSRHDENIAQVLLTHEDLSHRDRYLNVRNTLLTLLDFRVIPIINENDTVSVKELRFGDNDNLAALVTNLIEADMFICLTDVPCLYDADPSKNPDAKPVYTVKKVTGEIEAMVGNVKSALGTGGMLTKIKAAKKVSERGGSSIIGPGREENILQRMLSGEMVGTFFMPSKEKIQSRKSWIKDVLKAKGKVTVDDGAKRALVNGGKSLLPSGIQFVDGHFGIGDAVEIFDTRKNKIAVGLVNYSSAQIEQIKGLHTDYIEKQLGFKDSDEIMHRDNLVLFK